MNIYICDTFFDIIECDIAGYADGNTPCNFDFSLDNVTSHLEKSTDYLYTGLEKIIWKPTPVNVMY